MSDKDIKKELRTASGRGLDDVLGNKSNTPDIPDSGDVNYTNSSVRAPCEVTDRIDWALKKGHRKYGKKHSRSTLVRVFFYVFDQLSDEKKDHLLASEDDSEMLQRVLEYIDTD